MGAVSVSATQLQGRQACRTRAPFVTKSRRQWHGNKWSADEEEALERRRGKTRMPPSRTFTPSARILIRFSWGTIFLPFRAKAYHRGESSGCAHCSPRSRRAARWIALIARSRRRLFLPHPPKALRGCSCLSSEARTCAGELHRGAFSIFATTRQAFVWSGTLPSSLRNHSRRCSDEWNR